MLGPLVVRVGGQGVALPLSDVVRGLLAGMLLSRGEPLSVPRLTAMVWSDRAERTRPGSVHVGITRLRGWLEGTGLPVTVLREGPGYRLEHTAEVDLDRLADARPADSARERCVQLAEALRHYRGAVLADLTRLGRSDPLVLTAERLVRRRCLELADAAEAAGEPERAVAPLQTCAAADPYDEVVQARLVELLAAAERPAAALRHYDSVCRWLDRELGVRPSPRLHRAGASCRLAGTRPDRPPRAADAVIAAGSGQPWNCRCGGVRSAP
jgi:DNA-binding SARP family transcriptional activator